jgi:hypothetical protein
MSSLTRNRMICRFSNIPWCVIFGLKIIRLIVVSVLNSSGTSFMGQFPQARQPVLPYQSEQLRTTPWG